MGNVIRALTASLNVSAYGQINLVNVHYVRPRWRHFCYMIWIAVSQPRYVRFSNVVTAFLERKMSSRMIQYTEDGDEEADNSFTSPPYLSSNYLQPHKPVHLDTLLGDGRNIARIWMS